MPKGLKGFQKGNTFGKENAEKYRRLYKGKKKPEEIKRKISETLKNTWKAKGHVPRPDMMGNKNQAKRLDIRKKISANRKGKPSLKGSAHPFWKGGITPINRAIRTSTEYKLWRQTVLERDKYKCVWCGVKQGWRRGVGQIVLHADHIKPFSLFPELRFAIDNGRTLCASCHRKTDTYGSEKILST